jgi:hypothetical protein
MQNVYSAVNDNNFFHYCDVGENSSVKTKILFDGNHVERLLIPLKFSGIEGVCDEPVTVTVPCMEMYDEPCKIQSKVNKWFREDSTSQLVKQYRKRRSYIFQGFVGDVLKKFIFSHGLYRSMINTCPYYTSNHFDFILRLKAAIKKSKYTWFDFNIVKSDHPSGFADYSDSECLSKKGTLNLAQQAFIDHYGLFDLSQDMPPKPSYTAQLVMYDMFEASVNGEKYDYDKWGEYFPPNKKA